MDIEAEFPVQQGAQVKNANEYGRKNNAAKDRILSQTEDLYINIDESCCAP